MSNRRKDRPVPDGFTRYTGEYRKVFYTIITFHNVMYTACWPNAGHWYIEDGRILRDDDVFAIKEEE